MTNFSVQIPPEAHKHQETSDKSYIMWQGKLHLRNNTTHCTVSPQNCRVYGYFVHPLLIKSLIPSDS